MLFNSLEFLFLFLPTLLLAFFWLGRYSHHLALRVAGMVIGDHTARHPILAKLDADAVRKEIAKGKEFLEQPLNTRIRVFAYCLLPTAYCQRQAWCRLFAGASRHLCADSVSTRQCLRNGVGRATQRRVSVAAF